MYSLYYPVKSKIHSINPIIKLITLLLLLVPIIASSDLKLHVFIIFITFVIMYFTKVPIKNYINTIYGLRYIFILFIICLSTKGLYLDSALLLLLKILIIMFTLSIIMYTTSVKELKYGIEKILTPFNIFNINFSPTINTVINIILFFPTYFYEEKRLISYASTKGLEIGDILSRIISSIINTKNVLRVTIERLKKINLTNNLMGYNLHKYRTNISKKKMDFYDLLYLIIYLIFIVYYLWERGII